MKWEMVLGRDLSRKVSALLAILRRCFAGASWDADISRDFLLSFSFTLQYAFGIEPGLHFLRWSSRYCLYALFMLDRMSLLVFSCIELKM